MTDAATTTGQWWTTEGESITVSLSDVQDIATALLEKAGASPPDAAFIADIHLAKALQGDHERGVAMLADQVRAARRGEIDLAARMRVRHDRGATAVVDGQPRASGKLVCRDAMALAIDKALHHGVACVTARARAEILTPFIEQAVRAGLVTMVLAQSVPTVAPHGGSKPLLGNAPMGWGIPAGKHAPVIVDMSLTQTSAKGVVRAAENGQRVPAGFILDGNGEPTQDPTAFLDPEWLKLGKHVPKGSLVPLGGSHKSYALVFVVGLLTAVLADADFAWNLGNQADGPRAFGTLFLVLDPKAFGDPDLISARVDEYMACLRASPAKAGADGILYPGERSQALKHARRQADRLTLPAAHYRALVELTGPFEKAIVGT
jgi:ureidoglycolate dehydrogenase (NAD+)